MAKVIVKVLGGSPQEKEADTVGELREGLSLENYTATVNGETADDETELEDNQLVFFAPSVKGGI